MKSCRIFAVANQKGGVGKTTTAVNLSTALAAVGKRVLLVDFDPQGNASSGVGISNASPQGDSYQILFQSHLAPLACVLTHIPGLSVLPAVPDLLGAELELVSVEKREQRLCQALEKVQDSYDYIFIDCPPSLGLLTLNGLVSANRVIIPLQCEFYALEGLSRLLENIQRVRKHFNPQIDLQGVVLTMYDRRSLLNQQVAADARKHLGAKVYQTTIPRNIRIPEASSFGKPVLIYDTRCVGSQSYMELAKEFLQQESAYGY